MLIFLIYGFDTCLTCADESSTFGITLLGTSLLLLLIGIYDIRTMNKWVDVTNEESDEMESE